MISPLIVRVYNYFYFSLLAIFISFLPVYLFAQDLPASQIGIIISAGAFIGVLSQPFWGVISDKYKTVRKIILLTLLLSVIIGFAMFQASTFLILMLLTGLMYFIFLPTDPLTESLNYQLSQQMQVSFGSIRMFGAIGYATTSLLVGYLAEFWGISSLGYLFAAYGIITCFVCYLLPDVPSVSKPISFSSLRQFFTYPKTRWFFILVFLTALPHRMNDSFLGITIQSLGGTTSLIGQSWFISSVSEVFLFAVSFWFLQRFKEIQLISIAALLYSIRYFLCSIAVSPEWIVYLQVMQGITFVIFYTASIQYLYSMIPEEWKATGQTILAILFFGLSGIIGSLIGGWILEFYQVSTLYQMMAGLSFAGFIFSLFMQKKKQ